MSYLALFAISIVGTVFWFVSPEAALTLYAATYHWHPLLIGLIVATGQAVTQTLLFAFGNQLRLRWRWFDRQCERVRRRHGSRLLRGWPALATTSGLFGVPPVAALAALAPGLGLSGPRLLPAIFLMRVARFTLLATLATRLAS